MNTEINRSVLDEKIEIVSAAYSNYKGMIALVGKDNKVYLNGEELEETYLDEDVVTNMGVYGVFSDVVVPEGYVFAMGDNREHSTDSRCFGCVPVSKIEGKVWIRFWPFSKFGKVE